MRRKSSERPILFGKNKKLLADRHNGQRVLLGVLHNLNYYRQRKIRLKRPIFRYYITMDNTAIDLKLSTRPTKSQRNDV